MQVARPNTEAVLKLSARVFHLKFKGYIKELLANHSSSQSLCMKGVYLGFNK